MEEAVGNNAMGGSQQTQWRGQEIGDSNSNLTKYEITSELSSANGTSYAVDSELDIANAGKYELDASRGPLEMDATTKNGIVYSRGTNGGHSS